MTESKRPLGLNLLIWLYWFWTGAVVLVLVGLAVGEGPVPLGGATVPRTEALAQVLPVLLPMGLATNGAALALQLDRHWARPAALLPLFLAAFGPALSGTGTTLTEVAFGALAVSPIILFVIWYLYMRADVVQHFARLKEGSEDG